MRSDCEKFATVGTLPLHYYDHPGADPPLVLLPGLTANANSFGGLIEAGLSPRFRTLALDLRGRGRSGKPPSGYSMGEHAADVVGLLDHLGIAEAIPVGHSFGGLLGLFLAARHPRRFPRLVVLDVAAGSIRSEQVLESIRPSLERLDRTYDSWEDYIGGIRQAPYLGGFWNEQLEGYFRADVGIDEQGRVRPRSTSEIIAQAIAGGAAEDWPAIFERVRQPVLLINAPAPFGPPGAPPIVSREEAQTTVEALRNGKLVEVPGNHLTMLFNAGAEVVVAAVSAFVAS